MDSLQPRGETVVVYPHDEPRPGVDPRQVDLSLGSRLRVQAGDEPLAWEEVGGAEDFREVLGVEESRASLMV